MTVNAAFTPTIGAVPASTAGPMLGRSQVAGPYTVTKNLNEAAVNGDELTPETTAAGHWRLKVPADNAAGVYFWAAQTNAGGANPAVAATAAVWMDPGDTEWLFVPFGWRVIVKATLP